MYIYDYYTHSSIASRTYIVLPHSWGKQATSRMREEGAKRVACAGNTSLLSSCALSSAQLNASSNRATTLVPGGTPAAALARLQPANPLANTLRFCVQPSARLPLLHTRARAYLVRRVSCALDRRDSSLLENVFHRASAQNAVGRHCVTQCVVKRRTNRRPTDRSSCAGVVAGQPLRDDGRDADCCRRCCCCCCCCRYLVCCCCRYRLW